MLVIKRYANRKLYDTDAKGYITLDGIAEMIRRGQDVHVVDHEAGADITAVTLAQVILDQEKKSGRGLPRSVLADLIQAGSHTLEQLRRGLTTPSAEDAQVNAEIERRIETLIRQGELAEDAGRQLLDKLISPGGPAPEVEAGPADRAARRRGLPSRADVHRLTRQVEALSAELDKLAHPLS